MTKVSMTRLRILAASAAAVGVPIPSEGKSNDASAWFALLLKDYVRITESAIPAVEMSAMISSGCNIEAPAAGQACKAIFALVRPLTKRVLRGRYEGSLISTASRGVVQGVIDRL